MRHLTFLIFFLLPFKGYASEADQASQLFSYFQATCPTQGEWTKAALGQTQSLVSVLKTVKDDPDCRTLSGAVSQLDFLNLRLQDLQARADDRQVLSLKKQQQLLFMQLASNPDSTMLPIIQQSLQANQSALAQYLGYQEANASIQKVNEGEIFRNLVISSNILLRQAAANQTCLLKNPSILTGITSIAGAVAAGAVSAGASLALSTGVNLLGSVIEFIQQERLGRKIGLLSQSITSHAYECVLESLTNQWCSAQDASNVIGVKAAALMGQTPKDQIWLGAKILDQDLPIVLNWLSSVEAGVDPANQGQGIRQSKVLQRRQFVQSAHSVGLGTLAEKIVLFKQATTDQQRWVVERAAIDDVLTQLGINSSSSETSSGTAKHPLLDIHSADYAPYYLIGLKVSQAPKGNKSILPFVEFDPFSAWPADLPAFHPDIQFVKDRFLSWLNAAHELVTLEFSTVLQPDPLRVVSDASTLIRNRGPAKSIGKIIDFLNSQISTSGESQANAKIYANTVERLKNILREIQSINSPTAKPVSTCDQTPLSGNPGDDSAKVLACIYQQAKLEYGTVFIQGRVERSVRIKLNNLLTSGQITNLQLASQLLASEDILKDIQSYSGKTNLEQITRDIEKSQEITDNNLQEFTNLFGKNIAHELQEKMRLEQSLGGISYYKSRAEMCLMLAAVPVWPRAIPKELCLDIQVPAFFSGGPASVKLAGDKLNRPLNERSCYYQNYLRQSQIFQDFQTEKYESAQLKRPETRQVQGFEIRSGP